MLLEICTPSIQSVINAQNAGAHRVELCANLREGGTTPSAGTMLFCKKNLTIPIAVLIRERGGDFCYSDEEVEVMIKDIEWCRDNGMNGVVIGALTPQRTVHIAHTTAMMAAAGTMSVTFHRAFDRAKNPYEAIETLKNLGVHRLLTSGQAPTAMEGVAVLKKLLLMAENQLAVMPGSGVTVNNIQQIIAQTGCREIHFSAKETVFSKMQYSQNETNVEMEHWESSEALIRAALLLC